MLLSKTKFFCKQCMKSYRTEHKWMENCGSGNHVPNPFSAGIAKSLLTVTNQDSNLTNITDVSQIKQITFGKPITKEEIK